MANKKNSPKQTSKKKLDLTHVPTSSNGDIVAATASYDAWLANQTNVVIADILLKHNQMTLSPFILLRATFYRFAQQWEALAGAAAPAPIVLTVGDLHIENFGTWRDAEGRLVWGVNDFDDVCYAPFTVDLVRLVVSAFLAIEQDHLSITRERVVEEVLTGYKLAIKAGGRPFVLAEAHSWLRDIAIRSLKKPVDYWEHLRALPKQTLKPPDSALECMERLMPERGLEYELVHRIAGEGSLGRPRYTGIAGWRGGLVARDVKAMLPSGWQWAHSESGPYEILYAVAVGRAVRCRDPLVHSTGQWIGRRIAPDCSRIELVSLRPEDDQARLLSSMGWETANIHIGTPGAALEIKKFLKDAKESWLMEAAERYVDAIKTDFEVWKEHFSTGTESTH